LSRLWERGEPLDERVLRYTAGEDHALDARLVPYDVRASIAHVEMLGEAGLLAAADVLRLREGLAELAREHAAGRWAIELADEDVHTALERHLTERLAAVPEAAHETAASRAAGARGAPGAMAASAQAPIRRA